MSFHPALARFKLRVLVLAVSVVLAGTLLASALVVRHELDALPPELAAKHMLVGTLLGRDIARAVELGMPVDAIRGLDQLFADTRAANPEIGFIQFRDEGGGVQGRGGMTAEFLSSMPVSRLGETPQLMAFAEYRVMAVTVHDSDGRVLGRLALGVHDGYVAGLVKDRLFDIVTVQIVTLIFAVEMLLLLLDHAIAAPLLGMQHWAEAVRAGRAPVPLRWRVRNELGRFVARLHDLAAVAGLECGAERRGGGLPWPIMLRYVRFAVFLFVFADTLPLSFLPLYATDLAEPLWGLSRDVLLTLPVVAYWLMSAVVQFPGARLLETFNHRTVFAFGAGIAAAGALGSAVAGGLVSLILARAMAGLGLGLVFMVCQAAILTHVPLERRAMGLASFTGVFFLATFAGTALGGVLADQVGFRAAFLVSSVLALLAAAFAHFAFGQSREDRRAHGPQVETVQWRHYLELARNPRFAGLLLLSALPNRMFNVALIFYLAPLYLYTLGNTKAEIGRIVSIYGLTMALVAPLLARLVDRRGWHMGSVVAGSLVCALGGLAILPWSNTWGVLLAITAMGVGQALSIPSQMSLIPSVGAAEAKALGLPRLYAVFRMGERVPAFLGPIVGGLLAGLLGFAPTIATYAVWLAISAVALAVLFTLSSKRQHP